MGKQKLAGTLGITATTLFAIALAVFGNLNQDFNFLDDFVSKLGAKGEPNALWWNVIGFGVVGLCLFGFGLLYGQYLQDKLTGILLALFGVGFAFTAIPADMAEENALASKAHTVAICLALAFWMFGLSRVSYNPKTTKNARFRANAAALLIVVGIIGFPFGLWSMPLAHRLVFIVVFGWTAVTAFELLNRRDAPYPLPE